MKNKRLVWAIDIDGVITANPDYFKWWTHMLNKNNNNICIITGRNPKRLDETIHELNKWGISYHSLSFMPKSLARDYKTQGVWKFYMVNHLKVDIWLDNDFKVYERECGIDFSSCLAERIFI